MDTFVYSFIIGLVGGLVIFVLIPFVAYKLGSWIHDELNP